MAMNRCEPCGKFVSFEAVEPDDQGTEISVAGAYGSDGESFNDIQVTGTVRVVLQCADCGQDLAETEIEFDFESTFNHEAGCEIDPESSDDVTSEEVEYEFAEGSEGKGRRPKRFYGAGASVNVTCGLCEASNTFTDEQLTQASHFEPSQ